MSSVASVKDQIMHLIDNSNAGIAYSGIMELKECQGDCALTHAEFPLVRYWEGLSRSAAEAILELTSEGRVRQEPTDTLAYIAVGPTLDRPIFTAELIEKASHLEQPHWMPVLLIKAA